MKRRSRAMEDAKQAVAVAPKELTLATLRATLERPDETFSSAMVLVKKCCKRRPVIRPSAHSRSSIVSCQDCHTHLRMAVPIALLNVRAEKVNCTRDDRDCLQDLL